MEKLKLFFIHYLLFIILALFSFWLMGQTLDYKDGTIYIATKAWSDFASHLPLIRSFSFGDNFPPEYPLFPGEPSRYHFLFYLLVGLLEKVGLPLDWALNLPSALSFFGLILAIYLLAKVLFESRMVAILAVIFFLFNGSLSFLEFFKIQPLSWETPRQIWENTQFPSFGPYDGKVVSAFWNLNIYTNQRHLALPLALLLGVVSLLVFFEKRGKPLPWLWVPFLVIFLALLPFSHASLFLMAFSVLGVCLLFLPRQRIPLALTLFLAGMLALPRFFFLKETATFIPQLKPGYLIAHNLTVPNFFTYWFLNLGLSFILVPVGFFLAERVAKKIFLAFFSLFILGNLVQFSPEMAANHKFFNVFLVVSNIFVAAALWRLWQSHLLGKVVTPILLFFLIFSGLIDFFPIKNDSRVALPDYPKNPDIAWIKENTPKNAVFLNSSYLYHPASLAGRKIFLGWPYFAWSAGYDTDKRALLQKEIYQEEETTKICQKLLENKIDYVETQTTPDPSLSIDLAFWEKNFPLAYQNPKTGFRLYKIGGACQ